MVCVFLSIPSCKHSFSSSQTHITRLHPRLVALVFSCCARRLLPSLPTFSPRPRRTRAPSRCAHTPDRATFAPMMEQTPLAPFNYTPLGKKTVPVLPVPPPRASVMGENQFIFPSLDDQGQAARSGTTPQNPGPPSTPQGQKRMFIYKSQTGTAASPSLQHARNGVSSSFSGLPAVPMANRLSSTAATSTTPTATATSFQRPEGIASPSRVGPVGHVPPPPRQRVPPPPPLSSGPVLAASSAQASSLQTEIRVAERKKEDHSTSLFLDADVDDDLFLNIPDPSSLIADLKTAPQHRT